MRTRELLRLVAERIATKPEHDDFMWLCEYECRALLRLARIGAVAEREVRGLRIGKGTSLSNQIIHAIGRIDKAIEREDRR